MTQTFFARRSRWLSFLLFALPVTTALAATQYLYDDLGRLVLVANTDGSAILYTHDENGNRLTMTQWAASGPAIAGFSPSYGQAGTTLNIFGAGFDATPAQNAVTVGGVAATVSAASATQLTTTVPYGATTGPITVTVDSVTATSPQNFSVLLPSISGFTPSLVNPGGSVTVTGANLALEAGTGVAVNGNTGTIGSLSNASLTFAAPSGGGGPVTVTTPYGQATSATSLTIVPAAISVANVVAHSVLVADGGTQSASISQSNRHALFEFEAAAGQFLSVQLTSFSSNSSSGTIAYTVYSATGASIKTGTVSATSPTIHVPKTPTAGRYLVAFASGYSTSVSITARLEVDAVLSTSGTSLPASTTRNGQTRRFVFDLTAGDDLGFAITGLQLSSSPPNNFYIDAFRPNGSELTSVSFTCNISGSPGCTQNFLNVADTGRYQIIAKPQGAVTANYTLTLSHNLTGSLAVGTPVNLNLNVAGRRAWLSFSATANQTLTLTETSISTTPAGKQVSLTVYNAAGTNIGSVPSSTGATLDLPYLAAGDYHVLVAPYNGATATLQVSLLNGLAAALPTNGSTQNFSTGAPEQKGYFTFDAAANDALGFGVTSLTLTPSPPNYANVTVYRPNGSTLMSSQSCNRTSNPGCGYTLWNLPDTGTYRVRVEPIDYQSATYAMTLSHMLTGTLVQGTPLNLNLAALGQQGRLTFTATAGQNLSLNMSSVATTPANRQVLMRVYNPSGTQIAEINNTTGGTLNLTNLAAGTHVVLVRPANAATATMQIQIP